ncbi:Vegetative incompatibility protein HET-E-1-like protein 4 [Colletotrichum chlorophyti]|uniref:Vegetative incompatibility protein HET-E-1-like protein 4 n=1 Tax=Colletotrichum chlorophyti TaxID=708187 RepID=A0A1Q8S2X8_9PEZI|nr:Vegetative incompatibility protein HET-E-1-like protein 4 [Colletotrichum chlorophyti]
MRLVTSKTLRMEEFFENATPDYAVLSHTWGDEETSLQEFLQPTIDTKIKSGFQKIERTCKKALEYGYNYVAELSEAINSMFQWYKKAEMRFAYLADVPSMEDMSLPFFAASRWFTRGWTLRELLGP